MSISKVEAFDLGFRFANRIRVCGDSRDVARVVTCEDFPPEVQAIAGAINGFCGKDAGVFQAMGLIRDLLTTEDKDGQEEETQGLQSL